VTHAKQEDRYNPKTEGKSSVLRQKPATQPGDLWLCGAHRVLCGDSTKDDAVLRVCGPTKPFLLVTDPPYGIELDSEWRDRAGLNGCGPAQASYLKHRTEGHTNTSHGLSVFFRLDDEVFHTYSAYRAVCVFDILCFEVTFGTQSETTQ
jgi:hypothetical protein